MADQEKIAKLSKSGGVPEVEIIIGQAQWGRYHIYLWDPPGVGHWEIGSGLNVDQIPDKFSINRASATLDKYLLSWEVSIAAYESGPGQHYSVKVLIRQDGNIVEGGEIEKSGPLNGGIFVYDFVRFALT